MEMLGLTIVYKFTGISRERDKSNEKNIKWTKTGKKCYSLETFDYTENFKYYTNY